MGTACLMDSNVIIDYLDNKLPSTGMTFMSSVINNIPNISVISQIEILRYNAPVHAYRILTAFVDSSVIYPLDNNIVPLTIKICKQHRIKLPDAIIAATSIFHNLTLLTRNIGDFKNIEKLSLLNPWEK
jgi:predicted nucleic acid-binding protein